MKNTKQIVAIVCLIASGLLYQNCASQGKKYREVRLESEALLNVSDQNGKDFLIWSFKPSNETRVEITNKINSFCKRGFVLSTPAEKEWFYAFSKLKGKRNTASESMSKNIKVHYRGASLALTSNESQEIFDLMEKTKQNHDIRILECDGQKKWSFKKLKAERVTKTKANSKIVQTFVINVINDKIEMSLDEQPIRIAKNQDEAFCSYSGMTYSPTSKLLTAMFSIDEVFKNDKLTRGLASASDNTMMLEIDGRVKYTIDNHSSLAKHLNEVIQQMKVAKAAKKTCGYSY